MSYQPKEGSGALFKNDKGDNAARPDYRGDICINGDLYELAAWVKPLPSDPSKRYMSISAKPKQVQAQAPAQRPTPGRQAAQSGRSSGGFTDMEDAIPFADPMKRRAFALSI